MDYQITLQSWRMAYYMSGAFGLMVAFLSALTVPEPARKTIGEEREEKDESSVANRTVSTKLEQEEKKEDPWKVLLQPRLIMLCIAASIRHTGENYFDFCRLRAYIEAKIFTTYFSIRQAEFVSHTTPIFSTEIYFQITISAGGCSL